MHPSTPKGDTRTWDVKIVCFYKKTFIYTQLAVTVSKNVSFDMGRARKNCPVFGCGSNNLVKFSNHLAQVHGMDIEERAKWLKWGKMEICVTRHHGNGTDHELTLEKTLQELLKRMGDIETRFFMY